MSSSPDRPLHGCSFSGNLMLLGGWLWLAGSGPPTLQEPTSALLRYDLSEGAGAQVQLPRVLEEISGLATTPEGRLFGHDDERAIVYELNPDDGSIKKAFMVGSSGLPGDFEGLAIAADRFFLVSSDGRLLEFREGRDGNAVQYQIHLTGLGALCEIEGLAFDPREEALLVPCKEPRSQGLRGHVVVFSVELKTLRPYMVPRVFLPLETLARLGMEASFRPSAVEIHPETGTILLASGQDESLIELTPQGRILAARKLIKKEHPQTEGLAVLPDGSLLLADEGQGKRGRLTRYSPLWGKGQERP